MGTVGNQKITADTKILEAAQLPLQQLYEKKSTPSEPRFVLVPIRCMSEA